MSSFSRIAALAVLASIVATSAAALELGERVPECALAALAPASNDELRLSQLRGAVVWVEFWASWCPRCPETFAWLASLDRDYRARGLVVLGIGLDEDRARAERFAAERGVEFALALQADGDRCARAFDLRGMPESYLIDREGIVRAVHRGFRPSELARSRTLLERLLGEAAAHAGGDS